MPGATVLLKADTATLTGCSTNQDGSFRLEKQKLTNRNCFIEVSSLGYRTKTVRLTGVATNPAPLRVLMPGFCPYAPAHGRTPACVNGHTDHVVPIAYGLPSAKMMAKAKAGKVYLGGCQLTGCDPHYYCLIHKREL